MIDIESEIENYVLEAIEEEYRSNIRELGKYISVTEAIQCLRRSYFNRKFPHEVPSWSTSALIGKYLHELIERYFEEKMCDYIVDCEKTFTDGILSGTVDILLRDPKTLHSIVIDLKTATKIPSEPYYNHVLQVNTYLHLADADMGYVVYIDKRFAKSITNAKFIKAFKVKFYNNCFDRWQYRDYSLYQYVQRRAKVLKRCLEYDEIPDREWTESCLNCEHVSRCIE